VTDTRTPDRKPMTYYKGEMVPRREVERIQAAEATPATTPPPQDPATMPATEAPPTSTPRPVTPGRGDTRPTPTSSVTLPLIEGIKMEIAAAPGGGWVTRFTRNGDTLAEDRNSTEPWIDRRAPGRLTKALAAAVPTLKEKAIKEAITAVFDGIRESPDGAALISEPAARVINATESVTIEMTDPPITIVNLEGQGMLTFTAREIGNLSVFALNERWYSARHEVLLAKKSDFVKIANYWLSIAEESEPSQFESPWPVVAEELAARLAPIPRKTDRSALEKFGIWQEPGGLLWVRSKIFQDLLREAGFSPYDNRFARYLEAEGILIERSKKIRVDSGAVLRAYGLNPEFKIDVDSGDLDNSLSGNPGGEA